MVNEIITAVITFLLGGGLIQFINHRRTIKKEKNEDKDTFLDQELERYIERTKELERENATLRMAVDYSKQHNFEPPVISLRRINNTISWVSIEAILKLLEPLGISVNQTIGNPIDEVFKDYPQLVKEFRKLDIKARTHQKSAKIFEVEHLGKMLVVDVNYYQPNEGMVIETQMIEKEIIEQ